MNDSAFKAVVLAWSYGIVLSNRDGKFFLSYAKKFVPDKNLIRSLKKHRDSIFKALPEEITS